MWASRVIRSSNFCVRLFCWPRAYVQSTLQSSLKISLFFQHFLHNSYELVCFIRTRIQIALQCICYLIWLHNTLKFPSPLFLYTHMTLFGLTPTETRVPLPYGITLNISSNPSFILIYAVVFVCRFQYMGFTHLMVFNKSLPKLQNFSPEKIRKTRHQWSSVAHRVSQFVTMTAGIPPSWVNSYHVTGQDFISQIPFHLLFHIFSFHPFLMLESMLQETRNILWSDGVTVIDGNTEGL